MLVAESLRASNAIRVARSLSSLLYFLGAATALILPGMRASTEPGAIQSVILVTGCGTADTTTTQPTTVAQQSSQSFSESNTRALPSNYGTTTCAQWANELTAQQRHDSALDMLVIARRTMAPGTGTPSDALVAIWETNLTEACPVSIASLNIAYAAELLYRADEAIYSQ